MSITELVHEAGLIAVIDTPVVDSVRSWALAVAAGGIRLLGIPVTLSDVTEIIDELTDESELHIGLSNVTEVEQISSAVAAGAEFVMTPVFEPTVIDAARARGITVIAGVMTPTEIMLAKRLGADLVAVHPGGALGIPYFEALKRQFDMPLLASGGLDVDSAPAFLEAGAYAAIVDRGLFPDHNDDSATQIITMRAEAMVEVCAEARGQRELATFGEPALDASISGDITSRVHQDEPRAESISIPVPERSSDIPTVPPDGAEDVDIEMF